MRTSGGTYLRTIQQIQKAQKDLAANTQLDAQTIANLLNLESTTIPQIQSYLAQVQEILTNSGIVIQPPNDGGDPLTISSDGQYAVMSLPLQVSNVISNTVDLNQFIIDTETKDFEQDQSISALQTKDIQHESRMTQIETLNTNQNTTLVNHSNRMNGIDVVDQGQDTRLTAIEAKDVNQDALIQELYAKDIINISTFSQHTTRMDNIELDISQLSTRVDGQATTLTSIQGQINTITGIDTTQFSSISGLTQNVSDLQAKDVIHDTSISNIDQRITSIEQTNTGQDTSLVDANINITNLLNQNIAQALKNTGYDADHLNTNSLLTSVGTLQGNITTHSTEIGQLQTDLFNTQGLLTTAQGDILTNAGAITTLNGTLAGIQGTLTSLDNMDMTLADADTAMDTRITALENAGPGGTIITDTLTLTGTTTSGTLVYSDANLLVMNKNLTVPDLKTSNYTSLNTKIAAIDQATSDLSSALSTANSNIDALISTQQSHTLSITQIKASLNNYESLFVNNDIGSDSQGNGLPTQPFKTIQAAINSFSTGSPHVIYVKSSTTQDITFRTGDQSMMLVYDQKTMHSGNITLVNTNTSIYFLARTSSFSGIINDSSCGTVYWEGFMMGTYNKNYTATTGFTVPLGYVEFTANSVIDSLIVNLTSNCSMRTLGAGSMGILTMSNGLFTAQHKGSMACPVVANSSQNPANGIPVLLISSNSIQLVGYPDCLRVSCPYSMIYLMGVATLQNDFSTLSRLNFTGNTYGALYLFSNCYLNSTTNILPTNTIYCNSSKFLGADRTAINYTAANPSVNGHMTGIDTQIGVVNTAVVTTLPGLITTAQNGVNTLTNTTVPLLTTRVSNIEIKDNGYDTAITTTLPNLITNAQNGVNTINNTTLPALTTRVSNIESLDVGFSSSITSINSEQTTQNGRLDAIETINTTQTTNISALQTLTAPFANGTNMVLSKSLSIVSTDETTPGLHLTNQWVNKSADIYVRDSGDVQINQNLDLTNSTGTHQIRFYAADGTTVYGTIQGTATGLKLISPLIISNGTQQAIINIDSSSQVNLANIMKINTSTSKLLFYAADGTTYQGGINSATTGVSIMGPKLTINTGGNSGTITPFGYGLQFDSVGGQTFSNTVWSTNINQTINYCQFSRSLQLNLANSAITFGTTSQGSLSHDGSNFTLNSSLYITNANPNLILNNGTTSTVLYYNGSNLTCDKSILLPANKSFYATSGTKTCRYGQSGVLFQDTSFAQTGINLQMPSTGILNLDSQLTIQPQSGYPTILLSNVAGNSSQQIQFNDTAGYISTNGTFRPWDVSTTSFTSFNTTLTTLTTKVAQLQSSTRWSQTVGYPVTATFTNNDNTTRYYVGSDSTHPLILALNGTGVYELHAQVTVSTTSNASNYMTMGFYNATTSTVIPEGQVSWGNTNANTNMVVTYNTSIHYSNAGTNNIYIFFRLGAVANHWDNLTFGLMDGYYTQKQ